MFTNEELIKQWSNDTKRKAFIQDFKAWGVWFTQPELDLTFYKYDLPNGARLIALEYLRSPYPGERTTGDSDVIICSKLYYQSGAHFTPSATSMFMIVDHLKCLKEKLVKEMKQNI